MSISQNVTNDPKQQSELLNEALVRITRSQELTSGNFLEATKLITKEACSVIPNVRVGVWTIDFVNHTLKNTISYDSRSQDFYVHQNVDIYDFASYIKKLNTDRTIIINDSKNIGQYDNDLQELTEGYDPEVGALLDAPVRLNGEFVGVVCVEHFYTPHNWSICEQNFVSSLADFVALAIQSAQRVDAIRELNSNKKRLDSLMSNLPGMIYQCLNNPPDYTFTYVSSGSYALTGYRPEELLDNNALKFFDMIHPDDFEDLQQLNTTTLNVGLPLETSFRIIMRDGTVKWIWERSIVVEYKEDGTPHILEGFYTDITEQRRLEAAELASRTKGDFLANMSHEIRTPMNAIIGLTDIALRQNPEPQISECLNTIKSASGSLLAIINDILDFSKMEAGALEINAEPYHIESLINDVVTLINVRLERKAIDFIIEDDHNLPRILIGDSGRIKQILINLLTNAVKFTEKGCIRFKLWTNPSAGNQVLLKAQVQDSGIGIKKENLSQLFQVFTQVDTKRNRNIEGTGLGLAIVQSLLDKMGGSISVDSVYGEGSSFSFELPQRVQDSTPLRDVTQKNNYRVGIALGQGVRAESLAQKVQSMHVHTDLFTNPKEALDHLENITHLFIDFDQLKDIDTTKYPKTYFIVLAKSYFDYKNNATNIRIHYAPLTSVVLSRLLDGTKTQGDYATSKTSGIVFKNAHFLVVDDNKVNLLVAQKTFENYGAEVDTVLSGEEAIKAVQSKKYDMVFMDHMMPKMDGVEATKLIRLIECDYIKSKLPIIALTANAVGDVRNLFEDAGMNDYLSKPLTSKDFEKVARKWLPAEKWESA